MSYLVHLRTLLETYRSKSITKAAKHLGITQPAASMHLQALEALVGKELFKRMPRGVEPIHWSKALLGRDFTMNSKRK